MLYALLDGDRRRGLLLPWSGYRSRMLLDAYLDILELPHSSVLVYESQSTLKADIQIIDRPVSLNYKLYAVQPYRDVISRLKANLRIRLPASSDQCKYFLKRKSDRVSTPHSLFVQDLFEKHGYISISPEKLSISDQLRVFFGAKEIAGFSGSQMHNSIFCAETARLIVVGDSRDSHQLQVNQQICGEISGCQTSFAPYRVNLQESSEIISDLICRGFNE